MAKKANTPSWWRQRGADGRFLKAIREKVASSSKKSFPTKAPKTEFGGNYSTSQVYSQGPEFAFMSPQGKGYKQATTFVYCKDFLHDAIWSLLNKKACTVWGFKYDPKKNLPLSLNHTALAYRNTADKKSPKKFHSRREGCLDFLNQAEKVLGFQPTRIFEVKEKNNPCWLILGDKGWQHAPTMISLYSLFIRLGCFHKKGTPFRETIKLAAAGKVESNKKGYGYAGKNDCSFVKQGLKGIDLILKHGLKIFHPQQKDNYPESIRSIMHDSMGIVNFTAKRPAKKLPFWYRKEIWNK